MERTSRAPRALEPTYTARPTALLALTIRGLLVAFVLLGWVLQLVNWFHESAARSTREARLPEPELDAVTAITLGATGLGLLGVLAALAVCFSLFFHRANANLRAAGVRGLEHTPGWAAGWFYVPFANIVKPHSVACELWRASELPQDGERPEVRAWRSTRVPIYVHVWWISWLASNFVDNLASTAAFGLTGSPVMLAISLGVSVAAAVLAIHVVRGLHARVTARVAAATPDPQSELLARLEPWN